MTYNKYSRGSEWRKWDLHFHTPSSHDYKDKSVTNEDIIETLRKNEIAVVAITDHHEIDRKRINELQKLAGDSLTVLPGIELCSELGGSESIHFIGIFPEDANIESIWTSIQGKVGLTKHEIVEKGGYENLQCDLVDTCKIIHELGGLTSIHAGSKSNTIENIKSNFLNKMQQKTQLLTDSIDILELGNMDNENIYRNIVFKSIGFELPMIICSDNHDIKFYELKENLWIKSNPNFEGLKQIVYEPAERVKLQTIKPEEKPSYQVIDSIKLNEDKFWNNEILFNPNLNAIIGGRSTGKSTLLKCIAKKIDHTTKLSENEIGFVEDHVNGMSLKWKDGETSEVRDIEFFPQSYMYEIANSPKLTDELIQEIIKENDKGNNLNKYENFCSANRTEIVNKINNLFTLQDEIDSQSRTLKEKGTKEGIEKEIKLLEGKVQELNSKGTLSQEDLLLFEKAVKSISLKEQRISQLKEDIDIIKSLKTNSIVDASFEYQFNTLTEESRKEVQEIFANLTKEVNEKWINELTLKESKIAQGISKLQNEVSVLKESELFINGQKNLVNNKQYQDFKKRLQQERTKLNEIIEIEKGIAKIKEQRNNLKNKIIELHYLYKTKVRDLMAHLALKHQGIDIKSRYFASEEKLNEFFRGRLNMRSSETQAYVKKFSTEYTGHVKAFANDFLSNALTNSIDYKAGHLNMNVASELLSTNWFEITYDLTYQNDLFKRMSQGKQAFVILKLLLEFSDKSCPILIDQPEDSLDNRAIYNELVKYLKDKKKERQIILVTHNPNVVVSADAEQIIVANQDGKDSPNTANMKFQYVAGGLEFSMPKDTSITTVLESQGIREHVCEILEGGEDAFKQRERKYSIK